MIDQAETEKEGSTRERPLMRSRREHGCVKSGLVRLRHCSPNLAKFPGGFLLAQANEGGGAGEGRHDIPDGKDDRFLFSNSCISLIS